MCDVKVKATTEGFDEANDDAELDRTPNTEEQTQVCVSWVAGWLTLFLACLRPPPLLLVWPPFFLQFAHNIYMIKSEELGEVVTKLDQSCPHALDKKQDGKDEIEINIDAIDNRTFHILDRLVKVRKRQREKSVDKWGVAYNSREHIFACPQ